MMRRPDSNPAPLELEAILDPAWLQHALADIAETERVVAVEQLGRSHTLAHKVRFAVTLQQPNGASRLRTYCVKAHFEGDHETLLTEAHVYRDLLPSIDVRTPGTYYTGIDESTGRSLIIMDDIVSDGGRFQTASEPFPVAVCRESLAQLARFHAATWAVPDHAQDWLAPRISTMPKMYPRGALQQLLDDGRGDDVQSDLLDETRLRDALALSAAVGETCVIHGDTHSGNVYLDDSGRPCWLDWQITQRGHWSTDVSYHIATVLSIEDRRSAEEDLLRGYLDELVRLGVDVPAWGDAWEQYTRGFTWGFFLWTITRISSREVVLIHLPRVGAALADHDTFGRLGV